MDQTVKNYKTHGFYVQQIDRTSFFVNNLIWLKEFTIPKVYAIHPVDKVPIDDVKLNITIFEISTKDVIPIPVFNVETIVNSTKKAIVTVGKIDLKPGFVYEIQVEVPQGTHLIYNE